jgi:hypothetical protein
MTWNELKKEVDRRIKNAKLTKSPELAFILLSQPENFESVKDISMVIDEKDKIWISRKLESKLGGKRI